MSKQGKIRIPRELVYSVAELADLLGITEAEARNRCAAGLVPGAFKSSDGMMSRWYVFRPMFDAARSTTTTDAEALADRVVGALREAISQLRVTVSIGEVGR